MKQLKIWSMMLMVMVMVSCNNSEKSKIVLMPTIYEKRQKCLMIVFCSLLPN